MNYRLVYTILSLHSISLSVYLFVYVSIYFAIRGKTLLLEHFVDSLHETISD